jgi:hypothetical protein
MSGQQLGLSKGAAITKKVELGQNTEFRPRQTCDATFGDPHVCTIDGQSLSGTFRWGRSRK